MEKNNKKAVAQGAEPLNKDNVREIGKNLPAVIDPKEQAVILANTIKTISDLARLIKHRDMFEQFRDQLGDFELKNKDAAFDDKNVYLNCTLRITDDKNRIFELKSPSVIKAVVKFLFTEFDAKLAETEGKIQLPIAS